MPFLGTLVNVGAVIAGALIGVLFGKRIKGDVRDALMKVLGLSVMFIGVSGAMSRLLKAGPDGALSTDRTMMMIVSLVLGTVIGELINIEKWLERFGVWLKKTIHAEKDEGFVAAFVNTSLVICVGAMAVVGAIEDGLSADHTTLFAKAVLDFVIVIIMSSTMGVGCLFAFIPILLLQGSITALAKVCEPILHIGTAISDLSLVGAVMIFCIGVNLSFGKKFRAGNMLPALVIAVIWAVVEHYL